MKVAYYLYFLGFKFQTLNKMVNERYLFICKPRTLTLHYLQPKVYGAYLRWKYKICNKNETRILFLPSLTSRNNMVARNKLYNTRSNFDLPYYLLSSFIYKRNREIMIVSILLSHKPWSTFVLVYVPILPAAKCTESF